MTRATIVTIAFLLIMGGWTGYRLKRQTEHSMTLKEQNQDLMEHVEKLEMRNKSQADMITQQGNQIVQLKKHVANLDTLLTLERGKTQKELGKMNDALTYNNFYLKQIKQITDSLQVWNYEHVRQSHDGQGREPSDKQAGPNRQ